MFYFQFSFIVKFDLVCLWTSFLSRLYVFFGWWPFWLHKNLFFNFSLYFEGSPPAEDHQGVMQWGRSCYISMFPCSHGTIFDGTDQENSKTQGGRRQIRKIQENKKEMMEERKRRDLCACGGSHTRVFAIGWGCPGYHPCATLRQENPLIWEPPLQHHKIGKKTRSSCPPHKSFAYK